MSAWNARARDWGAGLSSSMTRKSYATDLTDEQRELLRLILPEAKPSGRPRSAGSCQPQ